MTRARAAAGKNSSPAAAATPSTARTDVDQPPDASARQRIALFGGTFDPVHLGHLHVAAQAREAARLDRVIFIPCQISPHKPGSRPTPGSARRRMLEIALRDLPWAAVDGVELRRPAGEPSYSWQTADHFARTCPEAERFWLMGADQWEAIDRWTKPERIAERCTFLIFPRAGFAPKPHPKFPAVFLEGRFDAAATDVRQAIGQNKAGWKSALPDGVGEFIEAEGLYR